MSERLSDERPSVRLYGEDGNVFSIIGRCTRAAREHGWNKERVDQFIEGCMAAKSYDEVLQLVLGSFDVE